MQWWLERGGDTTLASYGGDASQVPSDDIAWLDGLALMHLDRQRIYVHAGLDPDLPLDRQGERTLLWKRYPEGCASGFSGRNVVHGHDSLVAGKRADVIRVHVAGDVPVVRSVWREGQRVA